MSDVSSAFAAGDLLKYNRLWRAGMHFDYIFFRVSHMTSKGTIMGHYVPAQRVTEQWSVEYQTRTERWTVDSSLSPVGRPRRLPHPSLWRLMTDEDVREGVRDTSCLS